MILCFFTHSGSTQNIICFIKGQLQPSSFINRRGCIFPKLHPPKEMSSSYIVFFLDNFTPLLILEQPIFVEHSNVAMGTNLTQDF